MNAKDTITQAARDILDAANTLPDPGYRMLTQGDVLSRGDEEFIEGSTGWRRIGDSFHGDAVCLEDVFRRRVGNEPACLYSDLVSARAALTHYKAQCTKLEDDLKAKGDEIGDMQKRLLSAEARTKFLERDSVAQQANAWEAISKVVFSLQQYDDLNGFKMCGREQAVRAVENLASQWRVQKESLKNMFEVEKKLHEALSQKDADLKEEKFQHNLLKACVKTAACNAARKEPTTGWRLLDPEEILQHGDEHKAEIVGLWSGLGAHWIGIKASAFNNQVSPSKVRRKITASEENGYRTLARSETTREGDEFISPLLGVDEWTKATVGITIADNFTEHATVRRKIVRL